MYRNNCLNDIDISIKHKKAKRAIYFILFISIIVFIIGIIGYKYIFGMTTYDALFNTSLTMSNLGIGLHEKTPQEKVFTAIYSIVSGIFFIAIVSSIVAYIFSLYYE